ncbi:ankyrin repeat domain-containing protein 26-like [Heliangelus exortis]|uniref:ankyrin repeat domain-containing protein 26-like n=1 Tax=Heliangelus exortis TaxID=472823 RepID=UPI003A8E3DB8
MKAFQQGRKTSSLPPMEEVEKAEDFLWASPWNSEEKTAEQHGKEEKKELAVELNTAIAGCTEKYLLNGSPDEPSTSCREISGEHSGSTSHVSSPAKKRSLKEATDNSGVQAALAQLQRERHLFHQLLENLQEQQLIQGRAVTVAQEWFNEVFQQVSAAAEKQVYMLEKRNKALKADCTDLREQISKYEADKVKREGNVRKLQQELGEALKKLSVAEASLEVATKRCRNLEEASLGLEKELGEAKSKCRELEEQQLQYEHQIHHYKDRKRKLREKSQKLKDLLSSSSETRARVKELEERVQCLSMENARLEGRVQQQRRMIEALEGTLQASASIHDHLEDLMTSLGASRAAAEEQHQQQVHERLVCFLLFFFLQSAAKASTAKAGCAISAIKGLTQREEKEAEAKIAAWRPWFSTWKGERKNEFLKQAQTLL